MKIILPLLRLGKVIGLAFLLLLLVTGCLKIDRVNQPTEAQVGEIITVTVAANHTSAFGGILMQPYFGVHLPNGWAIVPPLNYTGGYTGSIFYDDSIATQMESIAAKPAYQWWAGIGNDHDPVLADTWAATGTLHIQSDNQAGIYYLDYMTGDSNDGVNYDLRESIPITITGNYGAGWRLSSPVTRIASGTTTVNLPLTLVDLGKVASDTFDLFIEPPSGWSGVFLTNVPITRTNLMTLYQSLPLTIQLNLPTNPSLGSYFIPVVATSNKNPNASASAFLEVGLLSDQKGYALSGSDIWVLDPVTHQTIKAVNISAYGSNPKAIALSSDKQRLYITFAGSSNLLILDTTTYSPIAFIPFTDAPADITFTCDGNLALVISLYTLHVIDTATSTVITSILLSGLPSKIATSCASHLALITSQNDNTLTFVDTAQFRILKVISDFREPADIVIAANGKRAYVTNVFDNSISVIDVINQSLLQTWNGSYDAQRLALSPDGQKLYTHQENRLLVINTNTGQVTNSIDLMPRINGIPDIEASPNGKLVFAIQNGYSSLRSILNVIDTSTYNVIDQVNLEGDLRQLALYPSSCLCQKIYFPLVRKK